MLPMTVLRRFDCVLAPTKTKVLAEHAKRTGGKLEGDALDRNLNEAAGQRFHNHSPLDFEKLKGDPDNIEKHLVSYIKGFSKNVRVIFDFFELETEIERMREANILYLVVSKFCDVDLHPQRVPNEQMGLIFENLIRRFNELANETAGDHFTPREVIRLMVSILFIHDDKLLATPGTVRKLLDPACGTGGMLAEAQNYLREHHGAAKLYVEIEVPLPSADAQGDIVVHVAGETAKLDALRYWRTRPDLADAVCRIRACLADRERGPSPGRTTPGCCGRADRSPREHRGVLQGGWGVQARATRRGGAWIAPPSSSGL